MTIQLDAPTPRRGKPPRHLADLSPEDRRAAVVELGEPGYRADQLSRHYFGRLTTDTQRMPDLPGASRARLAQALLPQLLAPVRDLTCDGEATRKTVWRLFGGGLVERVVMRYPPRGALCPSSPAGGGPGRPLFAAPPARAAPPTLPRADGAHGRPGG